MKRFLILLAGALLFVSSCQNTQDQEPAAKMEITKADLKTEDDKTSYTLGFLMGSRYKRDGFQIKLDILQEGLEDGFTGSKQLLDEEETKKIMMAMQQKMMAKQQAERTKQMEERKKQGEPNKEKG